MNKTLKFQLDGIPFAVRIIEPGDGYGWNRSLILGENSKPWVEFYDARWSNNQDKPDGQVICQYYLETILQHGARSLDLYGGEPLWTLTKDEMALVNGWLTRYALKQVTF